MSDLQYLIDDVLSYLCILHSHCKFCCHWDFLCGISWCQNCCSESINSHMYWLTKGHFLAHAFINIFRLLLNHYNLHWKNTICLRKNVHTTINVILHLDQDGFKYFLRQRPLEWAPAHTALQFCSVTTKFPLLFLLQHHYPHLAVLPQLHISTSIFLPCPPCLSFFLHPLHKEFLFIFYPLPQSVALRNLSFPCSHSLSPLLKIYTLHQVLSIKMPVKNKHAMVFLSWKINARQNALFTKLHLQPALSLHLTTHLKRFLSAASSLSLLLL